MRENPAAFAEKPVPGVPATRLARKDSPICADIESLSGRPHRAQCNASPAPALGKLLPKTPK